MLEELVGRKRKVGWADHGDSVGAGLRGVCRQRARLGGRLGAAMDDRAERFGARDRELRCAPAFSSVQQDPLAGRAEDQHAVDPAGGVELEQRPERILVELPAAVTQRRSGCRERP